VKVRPVKDGDIARITEIYNWYILNTTVSFEMEAITPLEMAKRVQEKIQKHEWLVGEYNGEIVGYTYYGAYHSRPAYSHTVESTIYLAHEQTGKGFGKPLYTQLVDSAKERGFREVVAVIALPNEGSTVLHQKLGFEEVGILKKVGHKFGHYIDVGIWQKSIT
jgi:L-amino acid N-acyltransferase YncA